MRGDEFLAQEGIPAIDFLKLDVEGAEHLVLQGLEANLREQRVRFVQFEYGQKDILTHFLLRDFYQLFASYGYIVGKIFPDYVEFRDYELNDEDFFGSNYLACPAGDVAIRRLAGPSSARVSSSPLATNGDLDEAEAAVPVAHPGARDALAHPPVLVCPQIPFRRFSRG